MISKTLPATKAATFCVQLPVSALDERVRPFGTGFFVSPDGWFITAAHVITQDNKATGALRTDLDKMNLIRPNDTPTSWRPPLRIQQLEFDHIERTFDLALFRASFADHKDLPSLDCLAGFPYIELSISALEDGDPIYIFGYPLNEYVLDELSPEMMKLFPPGTPATFSATLLRTRVTSAIIASRDHVLVSKGSQSSPICYVLDKPINPGNSGGPAISPQTGCAFGFCKGFQSMLIEQRDLPWPTPPKVLVPSLYGVVQSFLNDHIVEMLRSRGIPVSEE
jgi:serine protease Do